MRTHAFRLPSTRHHSSLDVKLPGTLTWTAHTLDIEIRDHYDALQLFGALGGDASTPRAWDQAIPITARLVNALRSITGLIIANQPVAPATYPHDREATNVGSTTLSSLSTQAAVEPAPTFTSLAPAKCSNAAKECAPTTPTARGPSHRSQRSSPPRSQQWSTPSRRHHRPLRTRPRSTPSYHRAWRLLTCVPPGRVLPDGLSNRADAPSRATMVGDTKWLIHSLRNRIAPELQRLLLLRDICPKGFSESSRSI